MPPFGSQIQKNTIAAALVFTLGIEALDFASTDALRAGFSGADESAHFINAYAAALYMRGHLGENPLHFATNFYLHYPKFSIGHWPPLYYAIEGLLFLIIPVSVVGAFFMNALVCLIPPILVASVLARLSDSRTALVGALVCALTPIATESVSFLMLDQAVAVFASTATIAWIFYVERRTWLRLTLFGALCVAAILTKGNGWLLALVPIYYVLITGRWRILASVQPYLIAFAVGLLVVPWYIITAKIAADGFNYEPGFRYALSSLAQNTHYLTNNVSLVGMALALYGVIREFALRRNDATRWSIVAGCISLVLATLTFQAIIPADIEARYLATALPGLIVLALIGLNHALAAISDPSRGVKRVIVGAVAIAVILTPGVWRLAGGTPKSDFRLREVAETAAHGQAGLLIIDGTSGAEGAMIAEMAQRDPVLENYVIRASKLLALSDFMGRSYTLRYQDSRDILAYLQMIGARTIVLVRPANEAAFPHSTQLLSALSLSGSPFQRTQVLPHGNRIGTTLVFEATGHVTMNVAEVEKLGLPEKVMNVPGLKGAR